MAEARAGRGDEFDGERKLVRADDRLSKGFGVGCGDNDCALGAADAGKPEGALK